MGYTDGFFYLHRTSDPDREIAGAKSTLYTCVKHKRVDEVSSIVFGSPVHEVCSAPTSAFTLPHKGCPIENNKESCLANDAHFHTLDDAWDACSRTAECGLVMKFTDGYFYMRRRSDPDREMAGANSMLYRCEVPTVYVSHDTCEPPKYGFDLPNKGCATHLDESSCIDGNAPYSTLVEAWHACGSHPECDVITKWTDGNFYLRRSSDPDQPVAGARSILYTCVTTSNRPVYVRSTTQEPWQPYEDCDDKVVRCSHTGPTD